MHMQLELVVGFPPTQRATQSTKICGYVRGSVQVKLVAVLDVEHEIASVQILHHKEQILLDTEMQVQWTYVRRIEVNTADVYLSVYGFNLGLEGAIKVCEEGIFPG